MTKKQGYEKGFGKWAKGKFDDMKPRPGNPLQDTVKGKEIWRDLEDMNSPNFIGTRPEKNNQ